MKRYITTLAILGAITFSSAQKKEIKALEKAVKAKEYAKTDALINAAAPLISNADEKTQSKFYQLKMQSILSNGSDTQTVIKALNEYDAFKGKKNEKLIENLKLNYVSTVINSIVKNPNQENVALKLIDAYKISDNAEYLYHAASKYTNAKKYDKALPLYLELKDLNYTGQRTLYQATNRSNNTVENFSNKSLRNAAVVSGTHFNPMDTKSPSVQPEIIKNIVYIYRDLGQTDNALGAIKDARAIDPKDVNLIITEADLYLKLGQNDKYAAVVEEALKLAPKNANLYYNLGVIALNEGKKELAITQFEKCIQIEPNNLNANQNISYALLKEDADLVTQMNALGDTAADDKKYDALQERRKKVFLQALPYIEKCLELNPNDKLTVQTLRGVYKTIGNTAKYQEMKAKLRSM